VALEITEEELASFLTESGMRGIVCKKLKNKDGVKFKMAAFLCPAERNLVIYYIMWSNLTLTCIFTWCIS